MVVGEKVHAVIISLHFPCPPEKEQYLQVRPFGGTILSIFLSV